MRTEYYSFHLLGHVLFVVCFVTLLLLLLLLCFADSHIHSTIAKCLLFKAVVCYYDKISR